MPESTFEALTHIRDTALVRFDSLFTPQLSLWTLTNLEKFHTTFVERLDEGEGVFLEKFEQQLAGAGDDVIQLAAELLYVQQFFTSQTKGKKKLENVQKVASWSSRPVTIPDWAVKGVEKGLAGDQSFNHHRAFHLAWLNEFLIKWHSLTDEVRRTLLDSPWQFRQVVLETDLKDGKHQPMREAWLYMIFPETFENISSRSDKAQIRDAFVKQLDTGTSDNMDADLLKIRRVLSAEVGEGFHFYRTPVVERWRVERNAALPPVPKEVIIAALNRFDVEKRGLDEWSNWETNGNYEYALEYEARRYPPKEIVSLATDLPKTAFSGGDQANRYLQERGFVITRLQKATASLHEALAAILRDYPHARESGGLSKTNPVVGHFRTAEQALEEMPRVRKNDQLEVGYSVGKGNWATVPWIAILDGRETDTTQHGRYVVFLFRSDCAGVYLTLNQGVTQPTKELGRVAGIQKLRSDAAAMRSKVGALREFGFAFDGNIQLGAEGLGKDYEASTIAHKFYPVSAVPSDPELNRDVAAVLDAYEGVLATDVPTTSNPAPQAWIFQANPKVFDIGAAIRALSELSWTMNQRVEAVRVGDRVYIWESGAAAGVIGTAEVVSNVVVTADDAASRPFWKKAEDATASTPRVRLRITRILDETLSRKRLVEDGRLNDLAFLKAPMGTNFLISEAHRVALDDLIDAATTEIPLNELCAAFTNALTVAGLTFGHDHVPLVRRFFASIVTKPFVILTGLSGSGKTQLALKFGEWLGLGRYTVVPVRPDWTGPEALLGYEDALLPVAGDRRAWHVPEALRLMLRAARDPTRPYALILDEMNLAHVERYFADVLSGAESREDVLPNLDLGTDGHWRLRGGMPSKIPLPRNLVIIGTVNVDETTYMFSPKVLDRANTIEFRVPTTALPVDITQIRRPAKCAQARDTELRSLLRIAADDSWHSTNSGANLSAFASMVRTVHETLADHGLEFGHRTYYESLRLAAILGACGLDSQDAVLDVFLLQKILPRFHGSRRKLEPVIRVIGGFAFDKRAPSANGKTFDVAALAPGQTAVLPLSYAKVLRISEALHANQFASFHD